MANIEPITQPTIQLLHPSSQLYHKRSSFIHFNDLQHDDTFILEFNAYSQSFILYLEPNLHLFHPIATTTILHPDGKEVIEPISPHHFRIYKGYASSSSSPTFYKNPNVDHWARITIRQDIQ